MTVEEIEAMVAGGPSGDQHSHEFPVGMRVLAVDDDPVCLKLLESLLRHCQYHVTTADRATKALSTLRENKDDFDLVISDVYMPDMDGIQLLELVAIEINIPVIMLSAHSDTETIMQGIKYGACNYLLKPARLEELKNIWQHVIRKRIFNSKDPTKLHRNFNHQTITESVEENKEDEGKIKPKRNVGCQSEEHVHHQDKNEVSSSSAKKKTRVVWTPQLHKKFLEAVNLLGIDKAMPKKILQLIPGENLTRENVASHLQKHRQYLKKYAPLGDSSNQFFSRNLQNNYRFSGSRQPVPRSNLGLNDMDSSTGNVYLPSQDFRKILYYSVYKRQQANLQSGMIYQIYDKSKFVQPISSSYPNNFCFSNAAVSPAVGNYNHSLPDSTVRSDPMTIHSGGSMLNNLPTAMASTSSDKKVYQRDFSQQNKLSHDPALSMEIDSGTNQSQLLQDIVNTDNSNLVSKNPDLGFDSSSNYTIPNNGFLNIVDQNNGFDGASMGKMDTETKDNYKSELYNFDPNTDSNSCNSFDNLLNSLTKQDFDDLADVCFIESDYLV